MPFNGSGTYSLPAGNPVVTGNTISSTIHNNTNSDIASALSNTITKDGQSTPSANLPMGTKKHTAVGDATARDQYASAGQVQDGTFTHLTSVSGADTVTASAPLTMTAYATGQKFSLIAASTNTTAVTLNINSIGAKSIKKGSLELDPGDIAAGQAVSVVYDGTQFQISSGSGGSGAKAQGVIYENFTTISEDYTLTTGKQGMSVGPISIQSGVSVTVPSGQRWVIL